MSRTARSVVASIAVLGALAGCAQRTPVAAGDPTTQQGAPVVVPAASMLRHWDEQRAAAYASGAVGDLRRLYVSGSAAGSADVRLLRRYVERGLLIGGMRMQVLALDVLRESQQLVQVRVTDRLVGAEVRGATGVFPLPRDTPSTRVVTLRNVRGQWRVASVAAERGRQP